VVIARLCSIADTKLASPESAPPPSVSWARVAWLFVPVVALPVQSSGSPSQRLNGSRQSPHPPKSCADRTRLCHLFDPVPGLRPLHAPHACSSNEHPQHQPQYPPSEIVCVPWQFPTITASLTIAALLTQWKSMMASDGRGCRPCTLTHSRRWSCIFTQVPSLRQLRK